MGSPISPLFADIVMDDLENDCPQILKDKHNCSLFYYRFVVNAILCVQKKFIGLVLAFLIHKIITYNSPIKCNKIIKLTFWTCH